MKIHIVKKSETMEDICSKYQVDRDQLLTQNPHLNEQFEAGTKIFIPSSTKQELQLFSRQDRSVNVSDDGKKEEEPYLFNGEEEGMAFEPFDEQYDEHTPNEFATEEEQTLGEEEELSKQEEQDHNPYMDENYTPPSLYDFPYTFDKGTEWTVPAVQWPQVPHSQSLPLPEAPINTQPDSSHQANFQPYPQYYSQPVMPMFPYPGSPQMTSQEQSLPFSPNHSFGQSFWSQPWQEPFHPINEASDENKMQEEQRVTEKKKRDVKSKTKKSKVAAKKKKKSLRIATSYVEPRKKRKKSKPWVNI